jgi:hypothetical protein
MTDSHNREKFAGRLAELRAKLLHCDPYRLASNTGAIYEPEAQQDFITTSRGRFHLTMWNRPVSITHPEFVAYDKDMEKPLQDFQQAVFLYYFAKSDGTLPAGEWISFSELPDGRFYNQAFQGYTGQQLSKVFQSDLETFNQAAEKLGGHRVFQFGDSANVFSALPMVPLLVVAWMGDEDFPPAYQVLFDTCVSHHLPTDACAILGSSLTKRLIQAKEEIPEPSLP